MTYFNNFFIVILLFGFSCNANRNGPISIKVSHFAGAAGLTRIYIITENEIQLVTNCDFQDCTEKVVYRRAFSNAESDSIQNFLLSLRLDTLKASYTTPNIDDGLFTKLTVTGGTASTKTSTFSNYTTPVTNKLFEYIDRLVFEKKYKFTNWGDE